MKPIYVKSLVEDNEAFICRMHTRCEDALNQKVDGRYLWRGEQRNSLLKLKFELEKVILGEQRQYKHGFGSPQRDFTKAIS